MFDVIEFADKADIIVNGFAVELYNDGFRVANLNTGRGMAVFAPDGTLIETNMDDIELSIARKVLSNAMAYAEV